MIIAILVWLLLIPVTLFLLVLTNDIILSKRLNIPPLSFSIKTFLGLTPILFLSYLLVLLGFLGQIVLKTIHERGLE